MLFTNHQTRILPLSWCAAIDFVALVSEVAKTDFTRLSSSESDVTVTASEF